MQNPKYLTRLSQVDGLSDAQRELMERVCDKFLFRANAYYLSLIDWSDPKDPIRRIIMPTMGELRDWGELDPSNESQYRAAPGLEHKYIDTALLLVSEVCGGFCRFCFRKRLFITDERETSRDVAAGLTYIREHPEITDVLLTGGDPLMLSTRRLRDIVAELRRIEHVQVIRIGSKLPAFNPIRILNDPELLEIFERYSTRRKRIYLMAHFNHPNELTSAAVEALTRLRRAGAILCNQTPLLRGVNDDPDILRVLFQQLESIGAAPYYVFQCRPTLGNSPFTIPIEEGYAVFREALAGCSGLARRVRFAMSHRTGKIEIVGMDGQRVYMRYHRAANPEDDCRMLVFDRNPKAYWLDDYPEAADLHSTRWWDYA